jgi:hypothetical protein
MACSISQKMNSHRLLIASRNSENVRWAKKYIIYMKTIHYVIIASGFLWLLVYLYYLFAMPHNCNYGETYDK